MVKIKCLAANGYKGGGAGMAAVQFAHDEEAWVTLEFARQMVTDHPSDWEMVEPTNILDAADVQTWMTDLAATTDGDSGADQVAATAISGWTGATVQAILESAKAQVAKLYMPFTRHISGDIAATVTARALGKARAAGTIDHAAFTLLEMGADGTDALSGEGDILINGTSIFTTKPVLAKNATDGAWSDASGTGVTVGVIDATKNIVAAGDIITFSWTLTRTTPETEQAGLTVQVDILPT